MVQRVVAGDEDDERLLLRPPRPAGLLPQRGERARVAGEHDGVEPGDVDAELQGVRRRDAEQVARPTAPAPARAAPRAGSRRGRSPPAGPGRRGRGRAAAGGPGRPPTPRCAGTARTPASGRRARPGRRAASAASAAAERRSGAPCSPVRSVSGGSHSANVAPGPGRAVVGDRLDGRAHQPARGGGGVGDRGRGQHEHRLGAVAAADPPQPAQHVPDVRAEDPAVGVALVDDDVGHPAQRARPLLVRRQDPAVEHVGVGHDPARVPPDPVPLLAGGVAVVGGRAHRRDRRARRPRRAGRGPAPSSAPGRARRRGGPRRAGSAPAAGRPATSPTPSRSRRRRAGRRGRAARPPPGGATGASTPRSSSRSRRAGAHPRRPRQRAALPDRHVVHVRDRLLVLVGAGEHRRQEVGARGASRRRPGAGHAASSPDRRGSRPDRVERRHPSTVTPRGNRRARRIPTM